ncbi:IS66 family transposase [Shewanella inventionis]|uniref:IS66 family transposase n=1 Tax=Shewanella inventionis TaxID=1738770 RepID=UPI001CBCC2E3|nr:IS66 family transposase [Shewanella inventionis]UAL42603.1 IS66 family transposase [Shewanella inventionis]
MGSYSILFFIPAGKRLIVAKPFNDIDAQSLDDLIKRVIEAKENNLALSADDYQLLLDALLTLTTTQNKLADHGITVHKLRKLLGIEKSSEKQSDLCKAQKKTSKKSKKLKTQDEDFTQVKPVIIKHALNEVNKGDSCPECLKGKVYKVEPGSLLRITGQTPFTPEQHIMERLRCNACGAYFTANLPDEVLHDGNSHQKYGYSARALMAIYKYFAGLPFYRQGNIQKLLGVNITASTVFDQVELVCDAIYPVYQHLFELAGDAKHYYLDDTTHRILDAKPVEKKVRNSEKTRLRSGVYTSGVIASLKTGHDIVLFETNIGHAGEFIDRILYKRQVTVAPILMSDALASNQPSTCEVETSLCNSHARRQFVDVINHFPEEVENILTLYGEVWRNEQTTIERELTARERLEYHQQHSLPILEAIKSWGEKHFTNESIEKNSGLGKAIRYFLKHYDGLSLFCHHEGVKIDNNRIESMLKIVVRDRKNAMFRKSLLGANIGDVITSMIATGNEAGINVFDYFTRLQRDADDAKKHPEKYLPWNYLDQYQ